MAFTPAPTPPNSGDPPNFNPRADAFLGWMAAFAAELNATAYPNLPALARIRGTAAAPVWSFEADPDTGIYSPAANQIAATEGGVDLGRLYGRNNIIGTVAQSGGVNTGAVMERRSNANGEYVRFADGTLICTGEVAFAAVSSASGAGFVSSSVFWTFPAAFTNAASVQAISGHAGIDCTVHAQGGSAVGSNIRLGSFVSITTSRAARVMAIGRWN